MTIEEAVYYLKHLDGHDQEVDHIKADEILLSFVPEEVMATYNEVRENIGFWYA